MPTNLDEVSAREKDIRYSSRTRFITNTLREKHDVRHAINELHKPLPSELASSSSKDQMQRAHWKQPNTVQSV